MCLSKEGKPEILKEDRSFYKVYHARFRYNIEKNEIALELATTFLGETVLPGLHKSKKAFNKRKGFQCFNTKEAAEKWRYYGEEICEIHVPKGTKIAYGVADSIPAARVGCYYLGKSEVEDALRRGGKI